MRVRRCLAAGFAAALVAAGAVALAPVAQAGLPPVVDPSIADGDPDSLRDVLENQITGGETVVLEAGATYVLDECEAGDVDIAADVTIEGNGATIQQTCTDRVLDADENDVALTITDATITGGVESGEGGGIDGGSAALVLAGVWVVDNEAGSDGGGIDSDGPVTITDSVIADNDAVFDGGGLDTSDGNAAIRIERSTFSGNCSESNGGAVSTQPGDTVTVVNSTITGNEQASSGAIDIVEDTDLVLVYSDVVGNTVNPDVLCEFTEGLDTTTVEPDDEDPETRSAGRPTGALVANVGLFFDIPEAAPNSLQSFGSVIALPTGGENCAFNDNSTVTSAGYNFSDDISCELAAATDTQDGGDPVLGALADNGGPTPTLLPQTGSPLVDAIPLAACSGGDALAGAAVTTDQRLLGRPDVVGQACDIGSVEIQTEPVVIEPAFTG